MEGNFAFVKELYEGKKYEGNEADKLGKKAKDSLYCRDGIYKNAEEAERKYWIDIKDAAGQIT